LSYAPIGRPYMGTRRYPLAMGRGIAIAPISQYYYVQRSGPVWTPAVSRCSQGRRFRYRAKSDVETPITYITEAYYVQRRQGGPVWMPAVAV
jgi:hypothetical protein